MAVTLDNANLRAIVSRGRGKAKVSISVSFRELTDWAKRMRIDTARLMRNSFGRAAKGLCDKFSQVMDNGGGVCGVPAFKNWEDFTVHKLLNGGRDVARRGIGGKLAERRCHVKYRDKKTGWQIIGWPDRLAEFARAFQDQPQAEGQRGIENKYFRRDMHRRGIKDVPRVYVSNPRRVLPEPFGSYVRENLQSWARDAFHKELARQMQKAGALSL